MRQLLSGKKTSYYGKGETIVYRLHKGERDAPILAAAVTIVIWGDAFWKTYTTGDNTGLVATDSMKNFVQRETLNYNGASLEGLTYFLGKKFLEKYPQAEGAELTATQVPFDAVGASGWRPSSGARSAAQIWLERDPDGVVIVRDLVSSLAGYELLRLSGSAFYGFVRDEYTTLPEMKDRPLRMKLEVAWRYGDVSDGLRTDLELTKQVNATLEQTFNDVTSGSIQQVIYKMGQNVIASSPSIREIELEGQNHTWDMVQDGADAGLFTVSKPFYGILGVTVRR